MMGLNVGNMTVPNLGSWANNRTNEPSNLAQYPSKQKSPSSQLISQVQGVDLNSLTGAGANALNRSRGWAPVMGGKVNVRFKGIDAKGQTLYEARGGKSTVTIRADSFAAAAKSAVTLINNKALAPIIPTVTSKTSNPNMPPEAIQMKRNTRPSSERPATQPGTGTSPNIKRTKPSKSSPNASDNSSAPSTPSASRGNQTNAVNNSKKTTTPATQATAKQKEGINPRSSAIYAVTGAVSSYNVNIASGMSKDKALALIPAGFARDVIQMAISQAPLEFQNPYLEIAVKGGIGGVLTFATNHAAALKDPRALPDKPIHAGMVAAAFNVNGSIIGLRELQKNGYMGGMPADNPKDWKEWSHKYGLESAAIGLGVGSAMTPAVVAQETFKKFRGAGFSKTSVAKTAILATFLPAAQNGFSRAVIKPPGSKTGVEKNEFNPKQPLSDIGTYVAADAIGKKVLNNPMGKGGFAKSVGWGTYFAVLGEGLNMLATNHSLNQYSAESLKDVNTARAALTDIHTMRTHPANFMLGALKPGGNEAYNKALIQYQEGIYRMHPSLRPVYPELQRKYNPGAS